ncbi:MAG: polyribonucleotide nucleotidyltransferase [Clostridiales bacterium]|nr:polyribonucleotide nucleotidyltransferase [Clostridiales bacterium]
MYKVYNTTYAGKELKIEIGKYAMQTNGSCLVTYDGTTILATAVASEKPKEGIDFFPLSIDYQERLYSVGKIPGGYLKREGRPTDNAILVARAIDRPLRPFFPSNLRNDVVISLLVLSVNQDSAPVVTGMIGAVLATMISDIPFNGPICGLDVALIEGKYVLNPTKEQRELSKIDLTLAASKEKVVMIEAGAKEATNKEMMEAIKFGHKEIINICEFFEKITEEIGKEKFEIDLEPFRKNEIVKGYIKETEYENIYNLLKVHGESKEELGEALKEVKERVLETIVNSENEEVKEIVSEYGEILESLISEGVTKVEKEAVKHLVIDEGIRVDKRGLDEVRKLTAEAGVLDRVHGSGLFSRGETQVLSIATLGKTSEEQKLDGVEIEEAKRYMHHYNFPGFSVKEAKPTRGAGRREIGHGALAEKALVPVLPSKEEFPYAIRVVSEVLSSNGSTSQASVCGSSLALMDAGVPIKKAVAGISTGLFTKENGEYIMVTDIQGLEDFFGEMDFKVAGTLDGITAIQVDIKNDGLTYEIVEEAFERTLKARTMIINDIMAKAIEKPRENVSEYAPKINKMNIHPETIRELIGPGGKNINKIIDETKVEIDISENGLVLIYGDKLEDMQKAIEMIETLTKRFEVGEQVGGVVSRLATFGAFIDLGSGKEGLLHISKISNERINDVKDVLKEGQLIKVKIADIDESGKISLDARGL